MLTGPARAPFFLCPEKGMLALGLRAIFPVSFLHTVDFLLMSEVGIIGGTGYTGVSCRGCCPGIRRWS